MVGAGHNFHSSDLAILYHHDYNDNPTDRKLDCIDIKKRIVKIKRLGQDSVVARNYNNKDGHTPLPYFSFNINDKYRETKVHWAKINPSLFGKKMAIDWPK